MQQKGRPEPPGHACRPGPHVKTIPRSSRVSVVDSTAAGCGDASASAATREMRIMNFMLGAVGVWKVCY